jgi:uncharacterized membrane protein
MTGRPDDSRAGAASARMSRRTRWSLFGLCLLVGGSGILYFVEPGPYRRIVPAPLRAHAAALVAVSGVYELVCAALLALPCKRQLGAAALLFLVVFPANIQMAPDRRHAATPVALVAWLRLPLQGPLICGALRFRHRQTPVG